MDKEEILKGASVYISGFKDKIFVVKYGGSILDDDNISDSILDDIICLHNNGIRVVLVHGGGSEITRLMKAKGKSPKFVGGLRVTDKETVEIVDEALSSINLNLVKRIRSKGVKAKPLVSRETLTIKGKRKDKAAQGDFAGDVTSVDIKYINEALGNGSIPVVSPVGVDDEKGLYNINADLAAAEVAAAVSAEKFIMLTNVRGVMTKKGDEASLISTLHEKEAQRLIDEGVIDSGMIPKVQAGILALDKGVKKAHIINGKTRHSLLIEVFTDKGIGTELII